MKYNIDTIDEENAALLIINEFNPNNIPKCIFCNLISLINITFENNYQIIFYECLNKHKGNKILIFYDIK